MTDFASLAQRRAYREIARVLVDLERERDVFDLHALARDPETALAGHSEVEISYDPSPIAGCSVFGYYRPQPGGPALIVIHPSYVEGRDVFTILHELGHHIQRQHLAWASYRFTLSKTAGDRLEERVADALASELLFPDELAKVGMSSRQLAELDAQSRGSRAAVAMRAAELAAPGESAVVVVADRHGVVQFARAVGGDVFAPARGSVQPDLARLISQAMASEDGQAAGDLQAGVRASSGWVQGDVTADVALDWSGLHAFAIIRPTQRFGRRAEWSIAEAVCPHDACGEEFVVDASIEHCASCEQPKCPECRRCHCDDPAGETCPNCFMRLSEAERQGAVIHECL